MSESRRCVAEQRAEIGRRVWSKQRGQVERQHSSTKLCDGRKASVCQMPHTRRGVARHVVHQGLTLIPFDDKKRKAERKERKEKEEEEENDTK